MQINKALVVGQFLLILSILPVAVFAFDDQESEKSQKSAIVVLRQGEFGAIEESHETRKELSNGVFAFKTIAEKEQEEHNQKRLAHYKPRLNNYVPPQDEISILVTGYSSTPDQTWGDPFTTASGTKVHVGTMACPPQYPFGTKISIQGRGTYICEDRGGAIKGSHFDMWFESRAEAIQWGKRQVVAKIEK